MARKTSKARTSTRRSGGKAAGRKRAPAKRRKSRTARPRRWPLRLLAVGLLFTLLAGIYVLYLDHKVRIQFDGKRWAVPARVYGRPLELYPGAALAPAQLVAELNRLGYRKVRHPKDDGSWSRNRERFLLRSRPFLFWDGTEPGHYLDLRFSGDQLQSVRDANGRELALARLEAPEIGSIYPSHNEDRVLLQRDQLPDLLVKALVAVEDRNFYSHRGVDPRAILRALWVNIRAGSVVQGGSTLTQQLVKNFYLTRERSLWRKLNEAVMALMLDAHYAKDDILEAYANEIYLGQDGSRAIHGFGLASRFYFNRPLQELDLPRLALLVGLVRGPSYYDPRRHPQRAKTRRNLVLQILRQQGVISADLEQQAAAATLGLVDGEGAASSGSYPAFLELVRRQLHRDYREQDLTSEGLRIFTTFDPWVQQQAEKALAGRLQGLEEQHRLPAGKLQGAVVVAGSASGELLAVVGGRESAYAGFNRALDALRPIGSLIKPVIYLTALMRPREYNLVTPLKDEPVSIRGANGKVWSPENFDRSSHGEVPLHTALANSYNQATVQLGMQLGLEPVLELLRSLGVTRPVERLPSLLLGALELSPLEVTQLYQTLAAGGFYSPLRAIREVQAGDGASLQRYPLTVHQSVPAAPVYLLNRNLQEVVSGGTGRGLSRFLSKGFNVAGKTGTTDNLRDSWFAGYTGDMVAVVWVGRDDNSPAGLTGSAGALQVWGDMMRRLQPAPLGLPKPDSVETLWVDPASGMLASEDCESARQFPFIKGSGPTVQSSCVTQAEGSIKKLFRSFFE